MAQPLSAADARWVQSPTGFLANSSPRGIFDYQGRNAEIVRIPLVWVAAAKIAEPVTFNFPSGTETLPAGTSLPAVTLRNASPDGRERLVYCTPSRVKEKVVVGGLMALLENRIRNSLSDSQKCLEDLDQDGKFDRTLMVGEGPNDMVAGSNIPAVPYTVVSNQPIGPKDYVNLELAGIGKDSVSIWLSIFQNGEERRFESVVQGQYSTKRMTRFNRDQHFGKPQEVFGIRFVIVSADQKTKSARIEWPEDAPANALPIIPLDLNYKMF